MWLSQVKNNCLELILIIKFMSLKVLKFFLKIFLVLLLKDMIIKMAFGLI